MKLFLIRHGETVDNVAALYAGIRDSALTIHGVEQARRLGDFFVKNEVKLTHIFASPLSRARKTAEAVLKAQETIRQDTKWPEKTSLSFVEVPALIEQDFGFYEGKSFHARSDPKTSGRETHRNQHKDDPGFVDVESRESIAKRGDTFLDEHLVPLLEQDGVDDCSVVAVVSHGMLLSTLWRRLLLRLPRKSLIIAPEVTAARGSVVLEHLGGWSNTGYLELAISRDTAVGTPARMEHQVAGSDQQTQDATLPLPLPPLMPTQDGEVSIETPAPDGAIPHGSKVAPSRALQGWSTTILAVDSKQHLVGLKRQRGGIGRIAHDESQKKLDGFFKRQKKG